MEAKYLYISEGGERVFSSSDDPTPLDLKCVNLGTLYIIRLSDMTEVTPEGKWENIVEGLLCDTPDDSGQYHWVGEYL